MSSTFRARWLASSEVISQVLFTSEKPKKNKMAFVAIIIFTNKVTLWAASYSAKTIIHLSVAASRLGKYPPLFTSTSVNNCLLVANSRNFCHFRECMNKCYNYVQTKTTLFWPVYWACIYTRFNGTTTKWWTVYQQSHLKNGLLVLKVTWLFWANRQSTGPSQGSR